MSDLKPSLTEFDKALLTTAPEPPEMKPFSAWSEENNVVGSDPQSYVQYTDYLRESYLNQGAYTPDVEQQISGSLNNKLKEFVGDDEEAIAGLTAPKELPFEQKLEYVYSSLGAMDEDRQVLTDFKAGEAVVAQGDTAEDYQQKVAGLKQQSEEIVNRRYNDVKRSMVETNQLPLAVITNEDGEQELIAGDGTDNLTITQAIKASKIGGVSMKDALLAQRLLSPVNGTDVKLYKFKELAEISAGIAELAKNDSSVSEHLTGHARQLNRNRGGETAFDEIGGAVTRGVGDLLTLVGVESEENNAERGRIYRASHSSYDNTIEYITQKLNDAGGNYNVKDVRDAYESQVVNQGVAQGVFKLHQDPKDAGKNLYKTALGPVLNPAVFARKEDLANTLAAHPELSEQQKKAFTDRRTDVVKQNFTSYSNLLSNSAVGDEWVSALVAGRQAGKDDMDIFDEFVSKDENFNEFTDSVKGVALSVWDSVASLVYIAPAAMGADWAKEGLANMSQRQSDRREVAQLFGEQYGMTQDILESIAPLIVDVAATTALATATGGAAGAAYMAAKGSTQLTAKGVAKALTSNVLRASTKEGFETVAESAVAKGLIKETLGKKGARDKTIEALKAYNNEVAQKFGVTAASFIPAATRSTAMSYASLYNQFRKDPDMTEEQAHDRALGFALSSGAITGAITAGFGAIGRGGVEDALLKGMSFKEAKSVFQAMSNTTGITDDTVAAALKKVAGDSIKKLSGGKLWKRVSKNAVDEGVEEGIDQLVNSFVEDIALNQDTPMLERMQQVWHAAQIGGILGGGVPALQAAARKLKVTPMDQVEQRIQSQLQFAEDVSKELEGTGSPLTAAQVRSLISGRVRSRTPEVAQPLVEQQPLESKTSRDFAKEKNQRLLSDLSTQADELTQQLDEINDDSTLPKQKAKREAEINRRAEARSQIETRLSGLQPQIDEVRATQESLDQEVPELNPEVSKTPVSPEVFIQSMSDATPLDVETALNNIRNKGNLTSQAADDVTILSSDNIYTDAKGGKETTAFDFGAKKGRNLFEPKSVKTVELDYTEQQQRSQAFGVENSLEESKTHVATENSKEVPVDEAASKPYSSRPTTSSVKFDEPPFKGANAEERANKFVEFALNTGLPVNLSPAANYGLPLTQEVSRQSQSEFVASAVFTAYPVVAPPPLVKVTPYTSTQATRTYFDPVSGKTVTQKVKGNLDADGNGIFDNNPIVMADMLQSGKTIKVPRNFDRSLLNPAIRVENGFVVGVFGPVADGSGLLESKSTTEKQIASVEPNNTRAKLIERIPFRRASELPAGVKDFDPLNGGTTEADFTDTTEIKKRLTQFQQELEKSGEESNRLVQERLQAPSGELTPEFKAAAFESAKQEFLFNAQLFGLRSKLISDPKTIKQEIIAQTNSRTAERAAQRLLPFLTISSNNTELSSDAILDLFIDQKLQNNPDFANNTPPTFDSVLAKAVNRFKSQDEAATATRKARAANALPSDLPSSSYGDSRIVRFINSFGQNPVGDLASPESINSMASVVIDDAVDAINTDPSLRRTINRITLESIFDETPETFDLVQNSSARDIFGIFTSWLASGNANTRESVSEFMSSLSDGQYTKGEALQNALFLTNLVNRADGSGYESSDAVSQYRDTFAKITGEEISIDQARNTMIGMSKAVRTHLSRSNVAASQRAQIEAQNDKDIAALGLESGNPKSVIAALKTISKHSTNPSHKVVADLLLQDEAFIGKVKFVLGSGTADIAGKYIKQTDGSHVVFINRKTGNGRGLSNTLLEEYVHAFVSDTLNTPREQLKKTRRGVLTTIRQLETVLSNARVAYRSQVETTGPNPVLENALVDINEFFAQFLLSEDVQKFVKSLTPPKGATSFFRRFINKIVSLFPKVSATEANKYTDALMEVLDIGSNTYKTTTTDAKALTSSASGNTLSSAPVKSDEQVALEEQARLDEANAAEAAKAAAVDNYIDSLPEADRPLAREAIRLAQGLAPIGMKVVVRPANGSPAYVDQGTSEIYIDPQAMAERIRGVGQLESRILIGGIIHEEVAHTASFNSLSMQEIQNYIDSLSESDFQDIAREYYANSPQEFLDADLARLQSQDPQVVEQTKYRLAEEKLRMHLQKVTRGFTTEEDVQFWKSKPSLLAILKRYLTGVINRWVANKKRLGGAGDAAFNNMLIEMRAIEAGFVRQPTKMAFDPDVPVNSITMYGVANQDYTGLALAASPYSSRTLAQRRKLRLKMTRKQIVDAVEDSSDWKDFYDRHEALLKEYFGPDADLFQRILSATSQAASVKSNVALALKAYGQIKRGEPFLDSEGKGYLKGVANNLDKIREGVEELGGRKISNYDKASAGDKSKVVVDRHIANMLFRTKNPSKAQFEKAEKVLTEVANTLGWQPREVQAALWGASIRKSGETPVSYDGWLQTLNERNDIERRIGSPLPRDGGDTLGASPTRPDLGGSGIETDGERRAGSGRGRGRRTPFEALPDAPTVQGIKGGIRKLIEVADSYAAKAGISHRRQAEYVKIDRAFSTRLAQAYDEMEHAPNDPRVKEAYEDLIRQVTAQYEELVANGYKFWFLDPNNDPYEGKPWRAMQDLRENESMGVFPTVEGFGSLETDLADNPLAVETDIMWPYGSPNGPLKPVLANDLFRAVHDAFGHGLEGAGFRARGEENAWQAHVRLFYGNAVHAMTSETRGQNSWLNFGPYGEKNQTALVDDTIFADQKTGLLPSWAWQERVATDEPFLGAAPTSSTAAAPASTGIDHSNVVDLLELPMYELETSQPKNFITKLLYKLFAGEVSEPFRRLIQNREAYQRATEKTVAAYKATMDKLIVDAYGSYENAPMEVIARAQGYKSGNIVSDETLKKIDDAYDRAYALIEDQRKQGVITDQEATLKKTQALDTKQDLIDREYDAAIKAVEADRDAALKQIAKDSKDLAAHIIDVRQKLIIPTQKKLIDAGLDSKIGMKISKTGGIYITRSYRMFTDSSYYESVRNDDNYAPVRDAAMQFFVDSFLKQTESNLVQAGMDPADAKVEAQRILDHDNSTNPHGGYGQQALNAFLLQYKDGGKDSTTSGPRDYKLIEDNLKRRKDLPEPIRKLLGEYDAESGIDLILRTYSTVATLASQQTFLSHLKYYGEQTGLMVSAKDANATAASRKKYADFVPARDGKLANQSDPLAGMMIDPEFKKDLDKTLKSSYLIDNADTAEKAVSGIFGLAANLSGKAMAAKTLGSIGFYGRNAIGNLLFGASQGYFRFDEMVMSMGRSSYDALFGDPNKIDPQIIELIGLNVMGDELRAGVMRDLLNGKVTPEGIRQQITELGEKTKLIKVGKALQWAEKKAQDLSAALDAAYKVVYYNHELKILKEAQAVDTEGKLPTNETELKRLAARKVVMTAQSYSQAPPSVKAWTKSPLGLVFAPFIRFKVEVPRIVINTFKLASEEIATGNPVLVKRGRMRRYSMISMLGIVSSAVPMVMAALSGIGDEEDESMRASIPDYLRGHTFYYWGKGKDLKSLDATYLNPFSLMVDPFLRAYENLRRGEFTEAGAAFALGFVRDQYLDDQILAGAVRDATRNVNPSTGKPIWNRGADTPVEAMMKTLNFIASEAYAPRIGKDIAEGWSTGSLEGMLGEVLEGAIPARIHEVDLQKQYSRYLNDLNKRFTNVKSAMNQLTRNTPMSEDEVRDIIDENIEDRRRLNYELMRINQGFSSLGLSDGELLRTMKDMNVGKNRIALLSRGYMDRPSVKFIAERLLDPNNAEFGPQRVEQILKYYQNLNRYIPVRPVTDPE